MVVEVFHAAGEFRNQIHVGDDVGILLGTEQSSLVSVMPLDPRLHLFLNLMDVQEILGFHALLLEIRRALESGIVLV